MAEISSIEIKSTGETRQFRDSVARQNIINVNDKVDKNKQGTDSEIKTLNSKVGTGTLGTKAQDVVGAINELKNGKANLSDVNELKETKANLSDVNNTITPKSNAKWLSTSSSGYTSGDTVLPTTGNSLGDRRYCEETGHYYWWVQTGTDTFAWQDIGTSDAGYTELKKNLYTGESIPLNTPLLSNCLNLFNVNDEKDRIGYEVNTAGALSPNSAQPTRFLTHKIKVNENDIIYVATTDTGMGNNRSCIYKKSDDIYYGTTDGTVLNPVAVEGTSMKVLKFVMPTDGYFLFGGYRSNLSSFSQLNLVICKEPEFKDKYFSYGTHLIREEHLTPYPKKISELENDRGFLTNKDMYIRLKGKTWYALGDSITAQGNYIKYVVEKTGLKCTNYGVGGSKMSLYENADTDDKVSSNNQSFCTRYASMSSVEPDIVTVAGGTNDCYVKEIGTVNDTTPYTVAGATYFLIQKLTEKYPNAILIFANMPIRCDSYNWKPYADIVKAVCDRYGVPCINMYGESGLNIMNKEKYYLDLIHPNVEGGKRMGALWVTEMMRCIPE